MSTRRAALLALLCAGCAHRYPLESTEPRQGLSGVPLQFGQAQPPLPAGTQVRWELSDGTKAEGPVLTHAFPYAGEYTVTEVVSDADGARSTRIAVAVARRSPLMAVPPEAEQAVCFDHFWNRLPAYRALLGRGLGAGQLDDALLRMRDTLGVDVRDPESLKAAGIDLDEGLCWVTFPEERFGRYLLLGTFDDLKSGAAIRSALLHAGATFEEGPEGFVRARVPGAQDDLFFRHERGYLVVRMPGESLEPALALGHFARAPDTGLLESPVVKSLRPGLPAADVQLFMSRDALVRPRAQRGDDLGQHVQGLLGAFSLAEDAVTGTALLALDSQGAKPLAALFPADARAPTLPEHAPAGAALYLTIPGNARSLVAGLFGGRLTFDGDAQTRDGVSLQHLLSLLDRGAAVAGYFDLAEYYRNLIDTQVPMPRGELLLEGPVTHPAEALAALQQLLATSRAPPTARKVGSGTRLEFLLGGHPAGAFVQGDALLVAYGLKHFDQALGPPPTSTLASQLRAALPQEALQPGQLLAYLDVAQVIDNLQPKAPIPGTSAEELLRAELFTRVAAGPFAPVRDLLLVAAPAPQGLRVSMRLRLR